MFSNIAHIATRSDLKLNAFYGGGAPNLMYRQAGNFNICIDCANCASIRCTVTCGPSQICTARVDIGGCSFVYRTSFPRGEKRQTRREKTGLANVTIRKRRATHQRHAFQRHYVTRRHTSLHDRKFLHIETNGKNSVQNRPKVPVI